MRVVKLPEFLTLPAGTIFSFWGDVRTADTLAIKDETVVPPAGEPVDFWYHRLTPGADMKNDGRPYFDDAQSRWGFFDKEATFAVYEEPDLMKLSAAFMEAGLAHLAHSLGDHVPAQTSEPPALVSSPSSASDLRAKFARGHSWNDSQLWAVDDKGRLSEVLANVWHASLGRWSYRIAGVTYTDAGSCEEAKAMAEALLYGDAFAPFTGDLARPWLSQLRSAARGGMSWRGRCLVTNDNKVLAVVWCMAADLSAWTWRLFGNDDEVKAARHADRHKPTENAAKLRAMAVVRGDSDITLPGS